MEESQHRLQLEQDPSVLLLARWKRIVLGTQILTLPADDSDEGHVAGVKTSSAMRLAIEMSVDRRWVVSGS